MKKITNLPLKVSAELKLQEVMLKMPKHLVCTDTRPPSLAVRKKLGQASRASDRSHSEDSTSNSDSESEDSSSGDDSEPVTPTTLRKSASRRTDKDSGSTSQPRETSHDPETQLPPLQDSNSHTSQARSQGGFEGFDRTP